MNIKYFYLIFLLIAVAACKNPTEKEQTSSMENISELLDSYYEERLQYFPLEATAIADNRYNDKLPADISGSYREKLKGFYKKYFDKISLIDSTKLLDQDVLSYNVFKREMLIQLEGLEYFDNLLPINQFWSMHLTFPVLGSGSGNQPFKTVKDYENFLKRMDDF